MSEDKKKVAILGGGITGLTAAFYLQKEAAEKNLPIEVTLVEATHRLGGKMQTIVKDGFIIEKGPDSFLARKKSASRLAEQLGIANTLVSNTTGKSFILAHGRLHPVPSGAVMGIPTKITPFITTGLFSIPGKIRAAADFILPKSKIRHDESLGQFFRRRFGNEVVENLIEPLISGIYASDIDQMSLMATFPDFYRLEQKYRSLILGLKKGIPPSRKDPKTGNEEKKGIFLTPKSGLYTFIEALEKKIPPESILKGYRVQKVGKTDAGYTVLLNNQKSLTADVVISALPHRVLPGVFSDFHIFDTFKKIPSTSVATVALAFPQEAIQKDINGTGFVVSRNSDFSITACTWIHKKWPHACPEGKALLRCFVGRPGDEAIVDLSDDQIIKIVLEDVNKTMNITMEPEFAIVSRWKNAMPQYTVDHLDRLSDVLSKMDRQLPGVFLAGSSFHGLGIPDCIQQGEEAVKKVLAYFGYQNKIEATENKG